MKIFNYFASAAVVALLVGAFSFVHRQAMLEELERETRQTCAEHYRQMLRETHQLYQSKPERCLEIETRDMTARELLWHFEALCETGIVVHKGDEE